MTLQDSIDEDADVLDDEIRQLEARLELARRRRDTVKQRQPKEKQKDDKQQASDQSYKASTHCTAANHFLLLLSDSALPVGSFAFSSGLESFLAHQTAAAAAASSSSSSSAKLFSSFLPLSVSSVAASTLPFVLAAHRHPDQLAALDDQLDAAIICTVGRRASTAQGRALVSIWERSFRPVVVVAPSSSSPPPAPPPPSSSSSSFSSSSSPDTNTTTTTTDFLASYTALLRHQPQTYSSSTTTTTDITSPPPPPLVSGHYPPLFGAVCRQVGIPRRHTAYIFLLGHVKALVSAAVRASLLGPYQAQRLLAASALRDMLDAAIDRHWPTPVHEAGQSVPILDLWFGRHELLYSRIFNS